MKSFLLKVIIGVCLLAGGLAAFVMSTGGVSYWYARFGGPPAVTFRMAPVTRDNLLSNISASGTVEPEDVIDVGAQIVGQITEFGDDLDKGKLPTGKYPPIDFRSRVKKGAILAKLDDALFNARLGKAEADVQSAQAHVHLSEAKLGQAKRDWLRVQDLNLKHAVSDQDFETARTAFDTANADLEDAKAALKGAKATRDEAAKNVESTVIYSPVDGEILDRRVNVGQTVVSGLNAPSLFLIATDLKKMQVWASINEADIGHIHENQAVQFTVDAYPNRPFYGAVSQIRLNANMTQNVVTYTVVVSTDNSPGLLKPYMTANQQFKVEERTNVLQVPNAALRYRPQPPLVAAEFRDAYAEAQVRRASGIKEKKDGSAPKDRSDQATVWVQEGGFLRPVKVRTGLSDFTNTEISSADVQEGEEVVTGENHSETADGANNPFTPKFNFNRK
jgi:HlyD family secretion protein